MIIEPYLRLFCETVESSRGYRLSPLTGGRVGSTGGRLLVLGLVEGVHHQLHDGLVHAQRSHQVGVLEEHFVVHRISGERQRERNVLFNDAHQLGVLTGMRNRSMGPPLGINLMIHHNINRSSTTKLQLTVRYLTIQSLL